jgi:ribosome biogenesis GTPase / thiamine phosphate phosphatase
MPVPGDIVFVRILEDETTVIDGVQERRFALQRHTATGRSKTMAANIDTLVTVTALAEPAPRLITLDQLLAFAKLESIEALVVLTKPDKADPGLRDSLVHLYHGLGYTVATVNPKTGGGVDEFRALIAGRHALLSGNSGVGKSSIFKALGGAGTVGEVSKHGLGRQTTTTARLYRLGGGFLIDSPGVNEFGLGRMDAGDLIAGFPEMQGAAQSCRFRDCTHVREPDCGVQAAVAAGKVAESRYASYKKMLLEPT